MPSEFIKRQKNDFFRDFTSLGSLWFYALIALFFYISKNYALFARAVTGLLLIYLIVIIIRTFYFKERPNKYPHKSYIEKIDAASFPSLHSARTTFLSIGLMDYLRELLFSVLLVFVVILVAYSRIYLRKHDLNDVFAGVILGALVYFIVASIL